MSSQTFLFASLDSKSPTTARKVHIRRLYDLMQLCLQRNDLPRARKAWCILARCKEIDWRTMWKTGIQVLGDDCLTSPEDNSSRLEFLRSMRLQFPEQQEAILREFALRLIATEKYREALDELELYLHVIPYRDNPVLNVYAGLLALHLSQTPDDQRAATQDDGSCPLLRNAQAHLEKARTLDPENEVAKAFLTQISVMQDPSYGFKIGDRESDEERMEVEEHEQRQRSKRVKT
ncbi:hypothetical protein JAAARDRAFT_117685 [Jaapia argillacea MUCL 33604]|uniref:ER membrane protein complex subunit 2 n=1 Tax=Jaapia argillacea MUCL 33604 TaxID=933084 RepID=A0A067QBG9_9AGAM|nr:hypothetical protein JAAARDRAFT_117685 [Jaapia argillacea MUCL 33604]